MAIINVSHHAAINQSLAVLNSLCAVPRETDFNQVVNKGRAVKNFLVDFDSPSFVFRNFLATAFEMVSGELFTDMLCVIGQVVPIRDFQSVGSIPQFPCEYDRGLEQLTWIAYEASKNDDALTEVEEGVEEAKFNVYPWHAVHDESPNRQREADEHRAEQENQ